jgi:hypothetical protein
VQPTAASSMRAVDCRKYHFLVVYDDHFAYERR